MGFANIRPETLAQITTGAEIANVLPAIELEVEKMKALIINKVLAAIDAGALMPEEAQARWIEYAAAHRLLQRFNSKVRASISVAEQEDK